MKREFIVFSLIFCLVAISLIQSCTFDQTPRELDCNNLSDISYSLDVVPILETHCAVAGCHDDASGSAGYRFTSYDGAKSAVDNNRMIGVINQEIGFSAMPKTYKMEACEIGIIETWIAEGVLNN